VKQKGERLVRTSEMVVSTILDGQAAGKKSESVAYFAFPAGDFPNPGGNALRHCSAEFPFTVSRIGVGSGTMGEGVSGAGDQ
jgi:hypothetical protein